MKYNIITDVEITSVGDLPKLKILVEANKLDKPNFSKIARDLGVDRRTVKKGRKTKKPGFPDLCKINLLLKWSE